MAFTVSRSRISPVQVIQEGTPGSIEAAAPTTAGVLTYGSAVPMNIAVDKFEFRPHSSTFTRPTDVIGRRLWNVGFNTLMSGPGSLVAATAPTVVGFKALDAMFESCAAISTYVDATSITFNPATVANSGKSATVFANPGNNKIYKAHGVLGNITLRGNPRGAVELQYRGQGLYNVPANVGSEFTSWSGGSQRAQAFLGATCTINNGTSYTPVIKSFEFDMGNTISEIDDANSTNGLFGLFISDRNPMLRVTIGADGDASAGVDWDGLYSDMTGASPTTHAVSIAWGSTGGTKCTLAALTAQVIDVQLNESGPMIDATISYKLQHATAETEWSLQIT